jgi:hypothetical protein
VSLGGDGWAIDVLPCQDVIPSISMSVAKIGHVVERSGVDTHFYDNAKQISWLSRTSSE